MVLIYPTPAPNLPRDTFEKRQIDSIINGITSALGGGSGTTAGGGTGNGSGGSGSGSTDVSIIIGQPV